MGLYKRGEEGEHTGEGRGGGAYSRRLFKYGVLRQSCQSHVLYGNRERYNNLPGGQAKRFRRVVPRPGRLLNK